MKKLFIFLLCVSVQFVASAQKVYFIYFQSENSTPFYIKMGDKILSSSSSGYLILPKLVDSTYTFLVGQPANKLANEPQFSVSLNGKDKGFLLKNFESGTGLFDLQSLALIMPAASNNNVAQTTEVKANRFTSLLANASNDSSLLVKSESKPAEKTLPSTKIEKAKEPKQEAIAKPTATTEVTITTDSEKETSKKVTDKKEAAVELKEQLVNDVEEKSTARAETKQEITAAAQTTPDDIDYKRSVVMKRSESSTTEGFGLVYLDNINGNVDTIRLIIPNPKLLTRNEASESSVNDGRFLNLEKSKEVKDTKPSEVATTKGEPAVPKSNCKNAASEKDFFKIRRDMAAEPTTDKMIAEAVRHMKKNCFTTEQLRTLSSLFLTAEGKYGFFAEAYNYVFDPSAFSSLASEIRDTDYRQRFENLTKQN